MDPLIMAREYALSTLQTVRQAILQRNIRDLAPTLAEDIRFYTPIEAEPIKGKTQTLMALQILFQNMDGFRYMGEASGNAGNALRFGAQIADGRCDGIGFLRLNADGKVGEFVLYMRPMEAVSQLAVLLDAQLGSRAVAL